MFRKEVDRPLGLCQRSAGKRTGDIISGEKGAPVEEPLPTAIKEMYLATVTWKVLQQRKETSQVEKKTPARSAPKNCC